MLFSILDGAAGGSSQQRRRPLTTQLSAKSRNAENPRQGKEICFPKTNKQQQKKPHKKIHYKPQSIHSKTAKKICFSLIPNHRECCCHNPLSLLNHVTSKVKNTDDRTFYIVHFRRVHLWEGTKRSNLFPATERRQPTKCVLLRYRVSTVMSKVL